MKNIEETIVGKINKNIPKIYNNHIPITIDITGSERMESTRRIYNIDYKFHNKAEDKTYKHTETLNYDYQDIEEGLEEAKERLGNYFVRDLENILGCEAIMERENDSVRIERPEGALPAKFTQYNHIASRAKELYDDFINIKEDFYITIEAEEKSSFYELTCSIKKDKNEEPKSTFKTRVKNNAELDAILKEESNELVDMIKEKTKGRYELNYNTTIGDNKVTIEIQPISKRINEL